MWISGRRAFRPDSGYYRNVRRKSLRSSRRKASIATVIVAAVVALVCVVGYMFMHR